MPENPYLEIEDLPISTEEPKRVNPYLSARENPYLGAAEVPIFERGVEPTLFERSKEAVTDFFRRDPGLGPLAEEDYAAFKPADVLISEEPAVEPTIAGIPALDIEGQLPPAESIEPIDPTLAMASLTPEEAALGRPISTITGEPIPTPEEVAAGGRAAMAVIPYGFASAVRGIVPPALERAVMDPLTKAIVGKEYVSPIDEALKIGEYLPEEARAAVGVPAHMAGAIVPLGISFKTANAMMKAAGLPADLVLRTGPVMDRMAGHVARGGLAGAVYGGLEAGTPKGMAEDAAFFGALEGGLGAVGAIFRKIFSANWYRNLEVKERGLVVQSLDDMLTRGYSEGEILRQWDNPAWRAEALARRMEVEPVRPTTKDIAKEAIREELIKRSEAPVAVVPEEPIPAAPPTEIVPEVLPITPEPVPEFPPVLEELAVERKPILSTYGTPWKTEARASLALRSKRLKDMGITEKTHEVMPVEDGFGVVEKIEKPEEIVTEKEVKVRAAEISDKIKSEKGYIYHATNEDRALDISRDKLLIHKPYEYTDQNVWPDGSTEKRNYFSSKADIVWQFAPEEGRGVILRIKETDHPFKKEITGDIYSTKSLNNKKIEILGEDNKWRPIKKHFAEKIEKKPIVEIPTEIPAELEKMSLPELLSAHEKGGIFNLENKEPETSWGESCRAKFEELTGKKWGPEIVRKIKKEVVPKVEILEKPAVEIPRVKEEIPIESIKPEAIAIPEFKNTEEALAFGKIATPEQIEVLKAKRDKSLSRADELKAKGDLQGAMDEATRGQFFREAIESAEKEIEKPKEPVVEVPEKQPWEMKSEEWVDGRIKSPAMHREHVRRALKSGKLTHEKYVKLHTKNYGPLAEFMPEVVKKPVIEVPEIKKVEVEKPFEPDLATLPLEKITIKTKALREATGKMVMVKESAKETLTRIDEQIEKYRKILECL